MICPYFGKWPSYFELFIKSAQNNPNIDFHFFSDSFGTISKSQNIFFHKDNLESIRKRASVFLSFPCVLNSPYKLCDYKPIYKYLFPIAQKYEFWGFCDIDLIFGKISNFITENDLDNKYVIGRFGHFMLMKNDHVVDNLFVTENKSSFFKVYSSPNTFGFDERQQSYLNIIKRHYPDKVLDLYFSISDICVQGSNLKLHNFSNEIGRPEFCGKQLYIYDNGILKGLFKVGKSTRIKEILYIHLQKRPMTKRNKNSNRFLIIPNSFVDISGEPDASIFNKYKIIRLLDFLKHEFYWFKRFLKSKSKNKNKYYSGDYVN